MSRKQPPRWMQSLGETGLLVAALLSLVVWLGACVVLGVLFGAWGFFWGAVVVWGVDLGDQVWRQLDKRFPR